MTEQVVRLRPLAVGHVAELAAIWQKPEVARWWPHETAVTVEERLDDPDDTTSFTIEIDGAVAGFLQVYEEPDAQYRHAGIDIMLDPRFRGRGLGPKAIELALGWVAQRGHHRVVIDPDAANSAAIRAYEKVGFRPVGILRRANFDYSLDTWTDGLLMDLLLDEVQHIHGR